MQSYSVERKGMQNIYFCSHFLWRFCGIKTKITVIISLEAILEK